jgi:hypothetical protein
MKDYNVCTAPSTTDADATDTDSAKAIARMSEQEHIFYFLRGIPRNNEWKVFLKLMLDKNATMTATPDKIVTKLVEKEAAINRENGLAPEPRLFAKKGGRGGRSCKVGKSPKRDKRDDKRDIKGDKEKDFRKYFHCQRRGHTTENCLSKQRGDPPKPADTAAKESTDASATSTLTTSLENSWMVASTTASSSDWFIECECTTNISSRLSIFITCSEYPPNTMKVKGYNGVASFASGYQSAALTCQLPDGKTEMIILQEVLHLPGWFNLISQSQMMDKDIKVELVNHYGLNPYNSYCELIATAPEVDGPFVLDRVVERECTEYTDIDNSCLLALNMTGHAAC